jgi:anion-transporting  ArsA/GET3 family ATPase
MKEKLVKWKKEIDEISNCVWKVSLTHELGPKVEKIGENLKQIEIEVELSALEMNEQIERKIKNYPQHRV